ncbi:MAG: hypothetical protein KAX46_01510 [Chromatiaceae bacterium]|nr:hypothetical protein [Chromatiaceae bacterium]
MITLSDYFATYAGHGGITAEHRANAEVLLVKVNGLLTELVAIGAAKLDINPKTGSLISGSKNGGWRPRDCPEGADNSSHKEARGVDVYDADGDIDKALTDARLAKHGLYREHPSQTRFWCHLTDRAPRSGKRTFYA